MLRCCELERVLFTHDKDFLHIVHQWQVACRDFPGVVYTAQRDIDIGWVINYLETIAKAAEPADIRGLLRFLSK